MLFPRPNSSGRNTMPTKVSPMRLNPLSPRSTFPMARIACPPSFIPTFTYNSKKGFTNAKAQTQQFGSLGHRARLHGNELWLRSGCRQAGDDLADPVRRRTWRHVL